MAWLHPSFLGQWEYRILQCLEDRGVSTRIGFDVIALLQYSSQDPQRRWLQSGARKWLGWVELGLDEDIAI